jgi:putative transposase
VARSRAYYRPVGHTEEELALMERIDRLFTDHPMYGSRRMQVALAREGTPVGRRRIQCPMNQANLSDAPKFAMPGFRVDP